MDTLLSQPNPAQAFADWKARHHNSLATVQAEMQKLNELASRDEDNGISLSTLSVLMSEISGLVVK